ncbi:peptidase [Aurantiacibacter gangjinensis]|uniref:Peptidase n=1 Tax=Aurantiacibacter gangjinensis TaxID=502682 RepID=A0A0G9MNA9_9SPHN|nr:peptidase [Aurantiacibacter gangjinensis]
MSACAVVPEAEAPEPAPAASPTTVEVVQPIATPTPAPTPTPTPTPTGPTTFLFDGELTQGGYIRGQVPGGTVSARLGEQELLIDGDGRFLAAFDRDAGETMALVATLADGREIRSPVSVSPRSWNIERVNVPLRPSGSSEAFRRRRAPELEAIWNARQVRSDTGGWAQDFIWPATGRISGMFGRQRIYQGEPGSYHSGIDIALPTGTPFVSPADGVVTLATGRPYSLEGYLLIIDHGAGLNSAFLHLSDIAVSEGDVVRQGQRLGAIGSSGRATGPHLHWSLKWHDARLDPILFTGPMP